MKTKCNFPQSCSSLFHFFFFRIFQSIFCSIKFTFPLIRMDFCRAFYNLSCKFKIYWFFPKITQVVILYSWENNNNKKKTNIAFFLIISYFHFNIACLNAFKYRHDNYSCDKNIVYMKFNEMMNMFFFSSINE